MTTSSPPVPPLPPLRLTPRRPEDPGGLRGRLAFLTFARDPLGFVERLTAAHAGAARLPMAGGALVYLTDLDAVGELLLDRERVFTKDWNTRVLSAVLGNGLFTSEGETWRRQRNLIAPALHRKQIAAYVGIAARRAAAYADGLNDGEVRDVKRDMTRLTMEVVAESLFGSGVGDAATRVGQALEQALRAFEELIYSWRRFVPARWAGPFRRRLADASAALDGVVVEIIARKRAAAAPAEDLLSTLIAARDEDGAVMSDRQLRDEVVTMLLAGHETTAMALAFAIWFLAHHPDAADRVAREATDVLGQRPCAPDDVARLAAATAAFKETLRLRPPIWLFGREAQRDCVVGRWRIARGEQVLVSPWLMHRNPRWFEGPDAFTPERWEQGLEERLPRHAYLPFGSGPRVCAGLHFALMEGTVVLASLCRRWRVKSAAGELPLNPAITLRPKGEVRIQFRAR
jgi:cytochrome P450